MPEDVAMAWRYLRGKDLLFGNRLHFGLHYLDRCPEKWQYPNEKFYAALGMIPNIQCGPKKSTFDTPGVDDRADFCTVSHILHLILIRKSIFL